MSITRWRETLLLAGLAPALGGSENRTLETFHAIELRSAAQVQVEAGMGPALSITAGERVLQAARPRLVAPLRQVSAATQGLG